MFLGDLNVLEPDHQPRYKLFAPFEYEFYRQLTDGCGHQTCVLRLPPQARVDRLNDHSALSVRLAIKPSEPLITSAPTTVSAPPTLF
jgi:exodeoxyribonuclease-3